MDRIGEAKVWKNIHDVDPGELWEIHNTLEGENDLFRTSSFRDSVPTAG